MKVPIAEIIVPEQKTAPINGHVEALAASIQEVGLLQPIGLLESRRLVYGRNRLLAAKHLGWESIEATVLDLDDLHAELAMLDENLQRRNWTALEMAEKLARRKEIYLVLHPETKQGGAAPKHDGTGGKVKNDNLSFVPSFAQDTAAKTGTSRRTVERAVEIGETLTPAARTQLVGTPLENNKSQLKKLSELPADQQLEVAKKLGAGKAKTVDEALGPKSGQQKKDPRLWKQIEQHLGTALREVDALNKQYPHGVLHRLLVGQVKEAMATLSQWKEAVR